MRDSTYGKRSRRLSHSRAHPVSTSTSCATTKSTSACFTGVAQSPVDLDTANVLEQDPGQKKEKKKEKKEEKKKKKKKKEEKKKEKKKEEKKKEEKKKVEKEEISKSADPMGAKKL